MTVTESDCQKTIIAAATILGYRVAHFRPARTVHGWRTAIQGHSGFPDLVIAGHGRCIIAELKRHDGRVSDPQRAWLWQLNDAGVDARIVWLPDGQQAFIDELAAIRAEATCLR